MGLFVFYLLVYAGLCRLQNHIIANYALINHYKTVILTHLLISPPEKVFQVLCLSEFFQWVHTVICGVRMKVVWKSHGIYICFKNRLICFIFIYPFVVTKLYIRQKYSRFYCYCCFQANILYQCVGHDTISDNVVNLEHFFNFVFASINSNVSRQPFRWTFLFEEIHNRLICFFCGI